MLQNSFFIIELLLTCSFLNVFPHDPEEDFVNVFFMNPNVTSPQPKLLLQLSHRCFADQSRVKTND